MIITTNKCYGCMSCYNECPKNAIQITQDENGFYVPIVDENKCIKCNKCVKICPSNITYNNTKPLKAYSAFNKDGYVVQESSSGGLFGAISNYVLEKGGIVFSAIFDYDKKQLKYDSTLNYEINQFYRSKYVECYVGNIYSVIKEKLNTNVLVYFSGTPCHVAGLLSYLGKHYDNLITSDFACEGVPSISTLQNHLFDLEKEYNSKVISINFRAKLYGWHIHSMKIVFLNNKEYKKSVFDEPYMRSFLFDNITRESCLTCKYATRHQADITLADFWKYKDFVNDNNQDKGLSLVLINTEKGNKVIESILNNIVVKELDVEQANYNAKERNASKITIDKCKQNCLYLREHSVTDLYKKNTTLKNRLICSIKAIILKLRNEITGRKK